MSTMVIVRHAQASFFAEDYDQLSSLGEDQSVELGKSFVQNKIHFDQVYIGPNLRHRQTADGISQEFSSKGINFPEPVCLEELAEHTADVLVKDVADELALKDSRFEKMVKNFRTATEPQDMQRSFQMLFEATVNLWAEGRVNSPGCEKWKVFQKRARNGLEQIIENDTGGENILVVSSVGPISVFLQLALDLSDKKALELGWRLRNSSVSNLLFKGNRITLDHFNSVSHLLDKPGMITYR